MQDLYNLTASFLITLDGAVVQQGIAKMRDIYNLSRYPAYIQDAAKTPDRVYVVIDETFHDAPTARRHQDGSLKWGGYVHIEGSRHRFKTLREAAEWLGVSATAISANISGKTKTCKGYKFYRKV